MPWIAAVSFDFIRHCHGGSFDHDEKNEKICDPARDRRGVIASRLKLFT